MSEQSFLNNLKSKIPNKQQIEQLLTEKLQHPVIQEGKTKIEAQIKHLAEQGKKQEKINSYLTQILESEIALKAVNTVEQKFANQKIAQSILNMRTDFLKELKDIKNQQNENSQAINAEVISETTEVNTAAATKETAANADTSHSEDTQTAQSETVSKKSRSKKS